jgi:hypothetical protein
MAKAFMTMSSGQAKLMGVSVHQIFCVVIRLLSFKQTLFGFIKKGLITVAKIGHMYMIKTR